MFNFLSHRQREVFINKFPRTLENPERGGRHQFVLHQKAVFKEPCTHTHLQENRAYTRSCMHQHTWLHNETPYFLCNLKKTSLPRLSLISHLLYMCVHVHPSRTHMFTCVDKVTLRVFHQNSMQVLPGNWEMGGGVLICFNWTFSMATASWCEPVRRDTCGTLTQWQRPSWSSDPIKKQAEGGWSAVFSGTSHVKLSQGKAPEDPEQGYMYLFSCHSAVFPPKLTGHDLDQQSMIRTEEADITDNWRLSAGIWVIYSLIQSQLLFILSPVTQKISSYHPSSSALEKLFLSPFTH